MAVNANDSFPNPLLQNLHARAEPFHNLPNPFDLQELDLQFIALT